MGKEAIVKDMTEKLHGIETQIVDLQTKVATAHGHNKVALQERLEDLYEQRKVAQRRMIDVT